MGQPTDTLWNSQPRTLLKHQAYRRYLHCWMGKICQKFPRSAIVDAFAGPGAYLDGPDGSPMVIAKTFLEHSRVKAFNLLQLICLEKVPDRRDYLDCCVGRLPKVPRLAIEVPPACSVQEYFKTVRAVSHGSDPTTPVLWILDPFDISSLPFALVRACLAGPRDEVLLTWFADELYRFCEDPSKEAAIDRHFGSGGWREARQGRSESARKEKLLEIYQNGLRSLGGIHTGALQIASKNETARYALVFATHSDKGMECFNGMKWRMDPYLGRQVSEKRSMNQLGLFDDTPVLTSLRGWLESLAGRALTFNELTRQAGRLGYKPTHLRSELSLLAEEGLAVREYPLDHTTTPWPENSRVRFYALPM
jgi:three-Cys-motif partner protein